MGDTGYWSVLRGLANARQPALQINEGKALANEWHLTWPVQLLAYGKALLQNKTDWLRDNVVDRWVGGVQINSEHATHWRFDHNSGRVVLR